MRELHRQIERKARSSEAGKGNGGGGRSGQIGTARSFAEWLPLLPPHLTEFLASLEDYVASLGDDVQHKELRLYLAFKRLKNFATVVAQKNRLILYLYLNPSDLGPLPAIGRDVSQQGHWGTGDLELSLASQADLDTAKPLIVMSYQGRSGP